MPLIDTHCHLAAEQFDADREEVAARSLAAGVGIVAAATDLPSSRLNLELAAGHRGIASAVGVHPTETAGLDDAAWKEVSRLAASPLVSAIGETGLDYYWKNVSPAVQAKWFDRHIELALSVGKPLLVHARDSVLDVMERLKPALASGLAAVWHCFSASRRDLRPAFDFAVAEGVWMAVGGMATFADRKSLRAAIPLIPDRLLLLETDAPYLPPHPKLTDRNEPVRLIRVAEAVAELRGQELSRLAEITVGNAKRLFPALAGWAGAAAAVPDRREAWKEAFTD
ncbi:MAG: TatD family hydrolase [Planctomycetota bacterium]|jgi:TatD DNase family protein|nr:TatD family hydrolase [Planctomycetota bacterium]